MLVLVFAAVTSRPNAWRSSAMAPRASTLRSAARTSRGLIAEIGIAPISGKMFFSSQQVFFDCVLAARSAAVFFSHSRAPRTCGLLLRPWPSSRRAWLGQDRCWQRGAGVPQLGQRAPE